MTFIYYLIAFLVVINLIVITHEFGHYLAAKKVGVKVVKFSVGMGSEIFGFNDKNGTRWCFSWLPIGGYVMILGDDDILSSTDLKNLKNSNFEEDKKKSISSKSNWEKIFIAFAGPFANYIYAFVVVFFMAFFWGVPKYEPVIGEVLKGSAAEKAGVLAGDRILSVNGQKVEKYHDVLVCLSLSEKDEANFAISRKGREISIDIAPQIVEKKNVTGISSREKIFGLKSGKPVFETLPLADSLFRAFSECVSATKEMLAVFTKLFSGKKSLNDFGGVVQMARVAGNLIQSGNFIMLIMFTVSLSLNLGFINLFPLPVLDGGRILICFLEEITRKKINAKVEGYIMGTCAIFLIFLMLLTTINDVLRIETVNNFVSKFLHS